mmetsp:Transcript_12686/g.28034  ORF Transcript_12686/g.28034 Transcript_12686/m.28034 type:complete len:424 (+) Transcript_12686:32-1303(+)
MVAGFFSCWGSPSSDTCCASLCGSRRRAAVSGPGLEKLAAGVPGLLRLPAIATCSDRFLSQIALRAVTATPKSGGSHSCRTVCLIVQRIGKELCAEAASSSQCCSAEVSALLQLLARHGGRLPFESVDRLVIAVDAPSPPRLSCEALELLVGHLDDAVPVVLAWRDPMVSPSTGAFEMHSAALRNLYPHPCLYRHVARRDAVAFAEDLARRCTSVPSEPPERRRLFEQTLAAARATPHQEHDGPDSVRLRCTEPNGVGVAYRRSMNIDDREETFVKVGEVVVCLEQQGNWARTSGGWLPLQKDEKELFDMGDVHPVRYAAGALFPDGRVCVCAAVPSWAPGDGLDAFQGLAYRLTRQASSEGPVLFIFCDQFGVLHAPSAAGRNYLRSRGDVALLLHDEGGCLQEIQCRDLLGSHRACLTSGT